MNDNIILTRLNINTFEIENGSIHFNHSKNTERFCVLDKEREIAIDVKTGHKYRYVKSLMYFLSLYSTENLSLNLRYANAGELLSGLKLTPEIEQEGAKIIEQLKLGVEFPDGNSMMSNEEFFASVEEESKKVRKNLQKLRN